MSKFNVGDKVIIRNNYFIDKEDYFEAYVIAGNVEFSHVIIPYETRLQIDNKNIQLKEDYILDKKLELLNEL